MIAAVGVLMVASNALFSKCEKGFYILRSLGSIGSNGSNHWSCLADFLLGVLGSIVIMQGIGWITQTIIAEQTGVLLHGMNLQYEDLWVIGGIIIAGLIGGLGAAINAYRSDLVDNLHPTS